MHLIEGVTVKVYSAAKTVVDCFRYRNKLGLDVALEALYEYANRGCRWQAHVRLAPYEHPEACPVELRLWDSQVKALPGFDPHRDRLIVAREQDRPAGDAMLATPSR